MSGVRARRAAAGAWAILALSAAALGALLFLERGGPATAAPPAAAGPVAPAPAPIAAPVAAPAGGAPPAPIQITLAQRPDPAGPVAPALRAAVDRQAAAEVATLRGEALTSCREEVADLAGPATYQVHLAFDAAGREQVRSVIAGDGASPGLRACLLARRPGALRIEAPGRPMAAEVRVDFP